MMMPNDIYLFDGAFVKLEAGIEGLVHISEMSWTKRINHPSELVSIGDPIEVKQVMTLKQLLAMQSQVREVYVDPALISYATTLVAAIVLGAAFLGFGVAFAAERSRNRASRLFLASITYLPLLLGALALL